MFYLLLTLLVLSCLVLAMTEFLRGTKIPQFAIVATLCIISIVITSFFVLGWGYGLLYLVTGFLLRSLLRPVAAWLVARFLARVYHVRPAAGVGLPSGSLLALSRVLGDDALFDERQTVDGMFEYARRQKQAEEQLLDMCEQGPSTRAILDQYGYDRMKLDTLYRALLWWGAGEWCGGHWVPASALAYAEPLRYLLANGEVGLDSPAGRQIIVSLRGYFEFGQPLPKSPAP